MPSITACLVVHNEESLMERCLESLEGVVDEIVLVHDGPCTDRTIEIAEAYGARAVVADFIGEADPHRPQCYALATCDWIIRIDADEFLSEGLRAGIRELVATEGVDAWEVIWPVWSESKGRYITENGPRKRVLTRRALSMRSGLIGDATHVRGTVAQTDLVLEHRPRYDFRLRVVLPKWRRWARVHARQYLMEWSEIPQFGYPADTQWPARRVWGNRLSPLLIIPYGVLEFVAHLRKLQEMRPRWQVLRISAMWGVYAMLVQLYVVKYRYLK